MFWQFGVIEFLVMRNSKMTAIVAKDFFSEMTWSFKRCVYTIN